MNIYKINDIGELIKDNSYVGRGIVIGKSADGRSAVTAYFIMGRSENSRNRVFREKDGSLYTEPFDPSKVEDPSLIIYAALRSFSDSLIVTNGDQTDTIYDHLAAGKSFEEALETRCFEPDNPNFTPRISGIINFGKSDFSYKMSILKSIDADGTDCARYTFSYPSIPGLGHFIHTYVCDGDPIPTFQGEPERVSVPDDIDEFSAKLWNNLNNDNKISLYVRYTDIESGKIQTRLFNKNEPED
ncbi:MAG: IMP cyclohydrolase [Clostridia bacterium]|nr:IMP cyclohydrolase [Clostridia bacterium]